MILHDVLPCSHQIVDDAAKFISKEGHDKYDVIVVDSSDPVGETATPKHATH